MAIQDFPIDAVLDTCRRLQFGMADVIRRAQGHAFGAFGLGPSANVPTRSLPRM